jgi:hypothetical protein
MIEKEGARQYEIASRLNVTASALNFILSGNSVYNGRGYTTVHNPVSIALEQYKHAFPKVA